MTASDPIRRQTGGDQGRGIDPIEGTICDQLREAAENAAVVSGLTHDFYRYPARFSPTFATTVLESLSSPGDVVLDPFMGGGTTIVQALADGRRAVGNDCNSLSVFLARVKTTLLSKRERDEAERWCLRLAENINYRHPRHELIDLLDDPRTRNLEHLRARAIKKALAIALRELDVLPTQRLQHFARCVLLRTSQWALDGRKKHTSLSEFRSRLPLFCSEMLEGLVAFGRVARANHIQAPDRVLIHGDTKDLHLCPILAEQGLKADLVLTSPPYPGVHVLYHRWQINGRKESPAPYWVADCIDGHGAARYTFGDRKSKTLDGYFSKLRTSFASVRKVTRDGGLMIQLVAFSHPDTQLPRYLEVMQEVGFQEATSRKLPAARIWRQVPNRKWHANLKGNTSGASEVLLIHRAV